MKVPKNDRVINLIYDHSASLIYQIEYELEDEKSKEVYEKRLEITRSMRYKVENEQDLDTPELKELCYLLSNYLRMYPELDEILYEILLSWVLEV